MPTSRRSARFEDYEEVYFADACVPLEQAVGRGEVKFRALARGSYPGTVLADDIADGIVTVGYWDAGRPQTWSLDWHRNEGIEITFLARGSVTFLTRDGRWSLEPGQLTITRPWQEHKLGDPSVEASLLQWLIIDVDVRRPHEPWRWPPWIGLSTADLSRLTDLLQHNENPVWDGDAGIAAAFRALSRTTELAESSTLDSELRLLTGQLLLSVLQILEAQPEEKDRTLTSPRRTVRMFLEEIDSHLEHQWTLSEMADACGLGRSQFSAYVKELTNMSPVELLTFRRLQRGQEMLRQSPQLSITDISLASGFQSSQYFATRFRSQYGESPRKFRAQRPS